jgi:hypothetical protein
VTREFDRNRYLGSPHAERSPAQAAREERALERLRRMRPVEIWLRGVVAGAPDRRLPPDRLDRGLVPAPDRYLARRVGRPLGSDDGRDGALVPHAAPLSGAA